MKRSEASAMQKETIYGGDKKNNEWFKRIM